MTREKEAVRMIIGSIAAYGALMGIIYADDVREYARFWWACVSWVARRCIGCA